MKTSEPAITCSRSAAASRSVGSPAGIAREGAGEVATVDRGGAEARHVGRLVGDRHEPEPAAERGVGQPVGQGQAGGHALELVAVDPTDDRQGGTVSATDQVDQRETLRPVGGGGDPLSPRMGHHGAVRIVPPALTSRGWIVDNLTGAASPNAGPEGDSVVDATDAPSFIGVARARVDSEEKVRGATRYAADQRQPGLLHARIVPSVYAHARIRSIDASAALAMPGVVAVLTAADLPIATVEDMRMFEPLAREEALFVGHPIALVIAETETAAADAVAEVYVDAERLPVVTDLEAAMLPGGPAGADHLDPARRARRGEENTAKSAHAAVGGEGAELLDEDLSDNVHNRKRYVSGDSAAALAGSAVTAEGTFLTNWVYQGYIEPHASTAWIESDGVLTVSTSTQGIFYVRKQLAKIFGRPMNKVRVRAAPLGGSFGSKVVVVDPLAAGAALVLRRPVRRRVRPARGHGRDQPGARLADRRPDRRHGGRHADRARRPAGLRHRRLHRMVDRGHRRRADRRGRTAGRRSTSGRTAYRTNRFGTGSYRGPGGPQAAFALESLIDELADKLGIDAIELRTRNLVAEGDQMVDGEPWPGSRPRGGARGGPGASAVAGPSRPAGRRGGRRRVRRVARWQGSRPRRCAGSTRTARSRSRPASST